MKFTVSQAALAKALLVVTKGMATNSTLPILSGIYIRAHEGALEFQTTNLTISIRHKIAANVEEEGATVVSGKILTNIVKTLPDAAVTFEGFDRLVTITCDGQQLLQVQGCNFNRTGKRLVGCQVHIHLGIAGACMHIGLQVARPLLVALAFGR